MTAAGRWWRGRTLHARLSLLVTGAVAAAVLLIAAMAWLAVAEIQWHRTASQLTADADAIAAQPSQWLASPAPLPGDGADRPGRHHGAGPPELGLRWQILDAGGTVISESADELPVTAGARQVAAGQRRSAEERVTVGHERYLMRTVPATGGGAVQVAVDLGPAVSTLAILGLLLGIACVLGIAGAALLGRTVARAGLRPVQRLTESVEAVAVTADVTRPIPVQGTDEIARLGHSVNTMLAAIDTARRAQRTLVEDAGHELRTPLTSIRTNIELLIEVERQPELAHRLPPQERADLLRDLDTQVRELATLTTELVELAREETTREDVEPVELTDVVAAAIGRVRVRAPGLTFTTGNGATGNGATGLRPVTVSGRPGELERMLVNVLDNAAKWSPPGGTVHTRLDQAGAGWCELTIADTGPGIDEVDRPHVFDRFYRAAAARGLPGSGLGLAIVAQTAQQHGGTVRVAPNVPHGTVVTIRLPAAG